MLVSLSAELMKLRRRPAVWVLAIAWWVLALVFGYLFPYLAYKFGTGPQAALGHGAIARALPQGLVGSAVQGLPLFAGALAMLLGVLAAGSEYTWGTAKVIYTQGPGRASIVGGKVAALLLIVLGIVLVSFGLDATAAVIVAHATNSPIVWPGVGALLRGIAGGWLVVAVWCLSGVALGVLLRGTALAAGLGLVWALAVENLVRVFSSIVPGLHTLSELLPGTNAGALVAALGAPTQDQSGGTPGVTSVVGGLQSSLVLAAYAVLFIGLAVWFTRRRDLT